VPNGRRLSLVIIAIAAAVGFCHAGFRDQFELGRLTHEFNRRLVTGDTRGLYRLFNESFQAENSYARFDSAVRAWQRGRRFARAGRKIVEIRPPSAAVSAYYVFEGERDYRYLYENWVFDGRSWELAWVSRILDSSFQYGQADSARLGAAAEAALRWLVSDEGLRSFKRPLPRPGVLVLVRKGLPGEGDYDVPGSEVRWVSRDQARDPRRLPPVPYIYSLALVRLMGEVAQVTFDLIPADAASPGLLGRERSIEVFLTHGRNGWRVAGRGRLW
jgi:hypothetical protein